MALEGVILPEFDILPAVDNNTRFIGYQIVTPGVYYDVQFSLADVIAAAYLLLYTNITITVAGSTITNAFFATPIRALTIGGQTYPISAATFTQNTGTSTVDISPLGTVSVNDIIIAWR